MPIVFADALYEQHTARDIAVSGDLVRTVRRNCATLPDGEQDAFGRPEQLYLDRAFKAISRVGYYGVIVPGNNLARRQRTFLHAHVGTLCDPVDLARTHIRFGHGILRKFAVSRPQVTPEFKTRAIFERSIEARVYDEIILIIAEADDDDRAVRAIVTCVGIFPYDERARFCIAYFNLIVMNFRGASTS